VSSLIAGSPASAPVSLAEAGNYSRAAKQRGDRRQLNARRGRGRATLRVSLRQISSSRGRAGPGVKIDIPVHHVFVVFSIPSRATRLVEIDDIGLKTEADVRLGPASLDLLIARKREDVVAEEIRRAVVLVEPAVGGAINHIALGEDAAAAFVKIDAPAP